jgi:hypothetical protein
VPAVGCPLPHAARPYVSRSMVVARAAVVSAARRGFSARFRAPAKGSAAFGHAPAY